MEGLLRDVLPRDTQDGASAKKEGGLELHHPLPKSMAHCPRAWRCAEGFRLRGSGQPCEGSSPATPPHSRVPLLQPRERDSCTVREHFKTMQNVTKQAEALLPQDTQLRCHLHS